jgi:hypothetical protein
MVRAGHVARIGKMKNLHRFLFRKPERKGSFERLIRRCEDNIKINFEEIVCEGVD